MSQIEDLRSITRNHEDRIAKLERLLKPVEKELVKAGEQAENYLDEPDAPSTSNEPENTADLTPPPPADPETPSTPPPPSTPANDQNDAAKVIHDSDNVLNEMADAALGPKEGDGEAKQEEERKDEAN